MKQLKFAYTEKALAAFGAIEGRELACLKKTDYTDVSAVIITDAEDDIKFLDANEAIAAFGIPVFAVLVENETLPDCLQGKIKGAINVGESKHEVFVYQIEKAAKNYEAGLIPPFFKALSDYADSGRNSWTTPGHHGGESFLQHPAGRRFYEFFGKNMFLSDCSCSDAGMGDLLLHEGAPLDAERHAAEVFDADKAYFVLNGTSTANKMVLNAVLAPGDIVLYDRNNHKSISQGALIQAGAIPVYMEDARNPFGSIGGIKNHCFTEEYIRNAIAERDPVRAKAERPVRLAVIQLGTYDGCIYSARQVVDKIGHLCDYILFDSAWVGYEQFIPMMKDCSPLLLDLKPEDPGIFVTQSVHKQLAGFSQASQILKKDKHVKGQARYVNHKRLNNTFMLHESTSPIYSIFASLDVNAKMQDGEAGRYLWAQCVKDSIEVRKKVMRTCHYLRPLVPPMVHGKKWEDGDTEKMATDMAYWAFEPGAKWHGFEGYAEGQYFVDPMKLQFVTCGIKEDGTYDDFGIPGTILANFLRGNGIIPEKCDLNDILFLPTPAEDMTKYDDLVAKFIKFEKLVDEDAPMSEVLPNIYYANEDIYAGWTIRQLCQYMHDFYKGHETSTIMKRLFLRDYLPEYVMNPHDANMELIARHCELVPLDQIEGRVALEGALPYPPGLLCIQPGERWAPTVTKYFQILTDGINKMPGFEPEIQGVYIEEGENGLKQAYGYVLKKEFDPAFK